MKAGMVKMPASSRNPATARIPPQRPISPAQLRLLATLAAQPGRAFRRTELLEGGSDGFADERTVDAHVKNLRRRLGACADQLETVRGVGYRLRP